MSCGISILTCTMTINNEMVLEGNKCTWRVNPRSGSVGFLSISALVGVKKEGKVKHILAYQFYLLEGRGGDEREEGGERGKIKAKNKQIVRI